AKPCGESVRSPISQVVLLYWISYWIITKVLHFPAIPCNRMQKLATECESTYNPEREMGSALAAAGRRHLAKLDKLGVTGSSPVAPTESKGRSLKRLRPYHFPPVSRFAGLLQPNCSQSRPSVIRASCSGPPRAAGRR